PPGGRRHRIDAGEVRDVRRGCGAESRQQRLRDRDRAPEDLTLKDGAVDFIFNTNADGLPLLPEEIGAQCKVITEKICSGEILVGNP
ncbi:MAG: hypothetical protein IIX07_09405, partial [Lachnospiraceae bacterium]|nr:hypothetical protein [Lachnospiraceae bacterium]